MTEVCNFCGRPSEKPMCNRCKGSFDKDVKCVMCGKIIDFNGIDIRCKECKGKANA